MAAPQETSDNWPTTVSLNNKWRVIECRDRIQWILQYRKANRWRNRSFCGTRSALERCIRENIGPLDGLVGHLPARLEGVQRHIPASRAATIGGCNQIPAIEGVRRPPKPKNDYTPRYTATPTPLPLDGTKGHWLLREVEKLAEPWEYIGPGHSVRDWRTRMREIQ